jgi:DNA polymerase V
MAFPVPGDAIEPRLDLNQYLIETPAATFLFRVEGNHRIETDVQPGDLLVVNRALTAGPQSLMVGIVSGELAVLRAPLGIGQATVSALEVWGVVTAIIRKV